jgi:RNA polymerase sigma factor (sigma-70 family)
LIARFSQQRDETAEAAFRMLVERHGPMVVRVCRRVMGDGHAAEEAAQAVFLVLARKAGSIRVGTTVAPWLYGVARRVAARARVRSAARLAREERTARVVAAVRSEAQTTETPPEEDWEAVYQEVDRLPEKYRTPVVLCYLEGQTYEEAAHRIGCPVGTVRVRLSRARERLRERLTHRGFGPERVTAGGCLVHGPLLAEPAPSAVLDAGWIDSTVKVAQAYVAGRAAAAGVVPALTLALGDEVMRSLAMAHWRFALVVLAALGTTSTTALGLAGLGGAQDSSHSNRGGGAATKGAQAPAEFQKPNQPAVHPLPLPLDVMLRGQAERRLNAARQRVDYQRGFYDEGRITIDRYIQALQLLFEVELEQATTREQRVIAAQNHMERLRGVLKKEQDELKIGRGTVADVAEAQLAHELAAVALLNAHKGQSPGDLEALQKRVETLEQKLEPRIHEEATVRKLSERIDNLEQKLEQVMKRLDKSGTGTR